MWGDGVAGTVVDATWVGERVLGPGVLSWCEGPKSETHPHPPTPTPPFRTTPSKVQDRDA